VTGHHILSTNQALTVITRALPPGCAILHYMLDAQLFHKHQLTSHTKHGWCSNASLTSKQISKRTRESHDLTVMHVGREPTSHSSVLPCHPQTLWMVINPYPKDVNPLNPELNPICYLLALLGAHHFLHVSRIRVKSLTLRRLMSYIYGAPILDVSRSHTTTQHSR